MEGMDPTNRSGTIPDEATLLARMRAGEDDAFDACVRAYCGQLLVVARRILKNEEDAQDVVQETFLSAFKEIGRFEGRSLLGTWLHRIAVNAALGRLRTRQRRAGAVDRGLAASLRRGRASDHSARALAGNFGSNPSAAGDAELVQRCIGQLPEIYRTVLLLRDIEGLDTEETARMLDVRGCVVKTRLHRARQALRTLLDPYFRRGDA